MRKSFCGGMLCKKHDRKHICVISNRYVCGGCSVKTKIGFMTIDDYVEYEVRKLGKAMLTPFKNEFVDMVKDENK